MINLKFTCKRSLLSNTLFILLGFFHTYWSYYTFEFLWLIFIYTYRTMAFLKFLFCEKLKKFKSSLSFQIYIMYDLKNQVCDIYNLQFYICNLVHFSWLFVSTNMSTESPTLTLTNFFFINFSSCSNNLRDWSKTFHICV